MTENQNPAGQPANEPDPTAADPSPESVAPEASALADAVAGDTAPADLATVPDDDARDAPLLSRRALLLGGAVAGGVLLTGAGFLLGRGTAPRAVAAAVPRVGPTLLTRTALRISHGGGICEAPLYAGVFTGIFKDHGLNVELVKSAAGENTKDGISAGKYVAGPGIFFSWLKPIEQGLDVKLTLGLHEGCLRLVVPTDSAYTDVAQLRGKKIGVGTIGDSAMSFFSLDLVDAGINPDPEAGEVEWVVFDTDVLPQALKDGQIDAIAASDPFGLLPTLDGSARQLASNQTGLNAQHYCCAAAINGRFIREEPEAARALAEAWAEGSRYVGANTEEVAHLEVDRKLVAAKFEDVHAILKTYGFNPSAKGLRTEIEPGIVKFAKTGYLDKDTDPKALADLVYADLGIAW